MTAPNMAMIAASLERSLQNCSLNHHRHTTIGGGDGSRSSQGSSHVGMRRSSSTSSTSDEAQQNQFSPNANSEVTALELNSHVSLPYHWEQCLDLKTGEIYYINWRNGMKAKEDPRTTAQYSGDCYYSDDDDDNSSYDSEESSTESSPSSSREREPYNNQQQKESDQNNKQDHVLVVAGCKSCLMYYMVPKQHEDCPKCSGQLLHFDRSESGSP